MKTSHYISLAIFIIAGIWLWHYPDSQPELRASENILIVGTNAEYPPFEFKDGNNIIGLDIDIADEVAKRIGKITVFRNMDFDMLIPQLQFGSIDVIAAAMAETPERANQLAFTIPYLRNDPFWIITLADKPPIINIHQLVGKRIIVNQGFTAELFMQQIRGPILQALPTVADAFIALQQGKGYAFVTAASVVAPFFDKYGKDKFSISTMPGAGENYSLALSKKNSKLFKQVQQALISMEKDGTLMKIRQKWGLIT
ncbi:MAG TPA: transporter substrate-binding domain-containing protein [Candidatus Babeliales bacterium]|nr:transporter substrate-binding domain-containing protein [Candidatus Babeliales bacterium]